MNSPTSKDENSKSDILTNIQVSCDKCGHYEENIEEFCDVLATNIIDAVYCPGMNSIFVIVRHYTYPYSNDSVDQNRVCDTSLHRITLPSDHVSASIKNFVFYNCIVDHKNSSSFISLGAGYSHVLLCSSNGSVFSYSTDNRYGQTGNDPISSSLLPQSSSSEEIRTFKRVHALAGIKIKSVACGYFHSLFVDSSGFVYSCGLNKYGQLGRSYGDYSVPEPVTEFLKKNGQLADPTVIQISCGIYHSVVNTGGFF
ncbi:RCC1 and BTB domain-containing protein 2 [Smittium mucronatum]|uniref:RCC1 and BTB domain-containing protein 2 n=1 Tax=Smittium mucronatum TaxID=133383 RepID=A0A1R0GLZ4_9FUNG|nr:RCC1 and BTB domain-containing protein 2 [Smittium mucronatum]OLY77897.1 RCC1 and BTB domain-containing protein 2 [Smittium mucronatum]